MRFTGSKVPFQLPTLSLSSVESFKIVPLPSSIRASTILRGTLAIRTLSGSRSRTLRPITLGACSLASSLDPPH